jgi:hypothetical protein
MGHHGHQPQHQTWRQNSRLFRTVTTIILIERASGHTSCFQQRLLHEAAFSGVNHFAQFAIQIWTLSFQACTKNTHDVHRLVYGSLRVSNPCAPFLYSI